MSPDDRERRQIEILNRWNLLSSAERQSRLEYARLRYGSIECEAEVRVCARVERVVVAGRAFDIPPLPSPRLPPRWRVVRVAHAWAYLKSFVTPSVRHPDELRDVVSGGVV